MVAFFYFFQILELLTDSCFAMKCVEIVAMNTKIKNLRILFYMLASGTSGWRSHLVAVMSECTGGVVTSLLQV